MSEGRHIVQIKTSRQLRIKVCGMRRPTNLEALLQLPIDYVGFIFYSKSPRYVKRLQLPDDLGKLLGIRRVGVFVNEKIEVVLQRVKQYNLDLVQLHGEESIFYCQQIKKAGVPIIKAFSIGSNFSFSNTEAYEFECDYFLFDTKGLQPGGNGERFNWQLLQRYKGRLPFFLSGGIRPDMADDINAFEHPKLYGLDINSGFEKRPALKDVQQVQTFLKELETKDFTPNDYNNTL